MTVSVGSIDASIKLRDEFTGALARASDQLAKTGDRMQKVGRSMSNVGSQMTKAITLPIVAIGGASIKMASDFESSFAGVRKTVDATEDEFAELAQGIRDLSKEIPINVNELNRIAEAAGQLGIATGNILGFTETMAALGVATNLSAEQAAVSLARLANITGLPQTEFDRLGSTIVALGNNFATTESEIVDFALRIAGAGTVAGLTETEILSIGTAMTSVGVQSEAGGTAVQKVLLSMTESVENNTAALTVFARTAGTSAQGFAKAFKEDAAAAFTAFVEGLGRQGNKAFGTLDELNLKDQRLIRSFIALSGAGDLLAKTMDVGTQAFKDNSALAKEVEQRYKTFESQLTIFWNRLKDVGITLGTALLPILKDGLTVLAPWIDKLSALAKRFSSLSKPMKTIILGFGATLAAAGPLLFVIGQLTIAWGAIAAVLPAVGAALSSALAFITGPVGWIVAASALLLAWKPARDFLIKLGSKVFKKLGEWVSKTIGVIERLWASTREGRAFLLELSNVLISRVVFGLVRSAKFMGILTVSIVKSAAKFVGWSKIVLEMKNIITAMSKAIVEQVRLIKTTWQELAKASGATKFFGEQWDLIKKTWVSIARDVGIVDFIKDVKEETERNIKAQDDMVTSTDGVSDSLDDLLDGLGDVDDSFEKLGFGNVVFGSSMEGVIDLTDQSSKSFIDNSEAVDAASKKYDILKGTFDLTRISQAEFRTEQDKLSSAFADGEISASEYDAAMERVNDRLNGLEPAIVGAKGQLMDLVSGVLSSAGLVNEAIDRLFGSNVSDAVGGFVSAVSSGFAAARDSGLGFVDALKAGFSGLLDSLTGTMQGFMSGLAAMSGSLEGLLQGALSAFANFQAGNFVGGITAAVGVAIGVFDKLFGSNKRSIDEVRQSFQGFVSDILSGTDAIRNMGLAMSDFKELVRRDSATAAVEFRDAFGDIVDSVLGNISTMRDSIAGTFEAFAGIGFVKNMIGQAMFGDFGSDVVAQQLTKVRDKFFEVMGEMQQFMVDQSTVMLDGLTQAFGDFADLTEDEMQFAQTSVLQAFNAMLDAGVPLADLVEQFGPIFDTMSMEAKAAGFDISEEFKRLDVVMTILSDDGLQDVINGFAGIGAAATAAGNLGLLTAGQFDFFGDSTRRAFNQLRAGGLTSAEALAALAPQLQQLNDLQEQYNLELDDSTQGLLDQAVAQGVVTERGLTANDILIEGFSRVLDALNRLIQAMGGVPIAFEGWIDSVEEMGGRTRQEFRDIAREARRTGDAIDDALDDAFEGVGGLINPIIIGAGLAASAWTSASLIVSSAWSSAAASMTNSILSVPTPIDVSRSRRPPARGEPVRRPPPRGGATQGPTGARLPLPFPIIIPESPAPGFVVGGPPDEFIKAVEGFTASLAEGVSTLDPVRQSVSAGGGGLPTSVLNSMDDSLKSIDSSTIIIAEDVMPTGDRDTSRQIQIQEDTLQAILELVKSNTALASRLASIAARARTDK